jgi:hypothetical protein
MRTKERTAREDAIFISYRRDDTQGEAGRLYSDLTQKCGEKRVFMDVSGIKPGDNFHDAINHKISRCTVLLAVIGPEWLVAKNGSGRRRLDAPEDYVRLEIAAALKNKIRVIPVLVRAARMPGVEELPDDLRGLAYLQAVELTHVRWDSDIHQLIKCLPGVVKWRPRTKMAIAAGAVLLALVLIWPKSNSKPIVFEQQVPAGTQLSVKIAQTIGENNHAGDAFSGKLAKPVELGALILLPPDTPVTGSVVASNSQGAVQGSLGLIITTVGVYPVSTLPYEAALSDKGILVKAGKVIPFALKEPLVYRSTGY